MNHITESVVEEAVLDWFGQIGYEAAFGPDLAADGNVQERDSLEQVDLMGRLRDAAHRLNPDLADAVLDYGRQIVAARSHQLARLWR